MNAPLRAALLAICLGCLASACAAPPPQDGAAAAATAPVQDAPELHALYQDLTEPPLDAELMEAACHKLWVAVGAAGAEGGYSPCPDLAVKLAEQAAIDARSKEQQTAALTTLLEDSMGPAALESGAALVTALAEEDWGAAAARYDDAVRLLPEPLASQLPHVVLVYMLHGMPPANALREMKGRMGELPRQTILELVYADMLMALELDMEARADLDLEALAALETFGLDPRFVDADGRNAIHYVMVRFLKGGRQDEKAARRALRWVRYLTSRGVSPLGGAGWDPLDTALYAFLVSDGAPAALLVAQGLLEAGAEVGASHRALAAFVRATAPDAYAELTAALPELG